MSVVAAVDVGTNSFHLIVAEIDPSGHFKVLTREKEGVRLGAGAADMKQLDADAIDRGVEALARMSSIARSRGAVDVRAVATSAVREASNGDVFVARAAAEASVVVEVVSGTEEARLIHQGVAHSPHVAQQRHLVIDVGGGSTEFIVGEGSRLLLARSLKLGAIRLTDRFFPGGVSSGRAAERCATHIDSFLGGLPAEIADLGFDVAVGSSGTMITLARMCAAATRGDDGTNGCVASASGGGAGFVRAGELFIDRSVLEPLARDLVAAETPEERLAFAGLEERRADIIVAGALLVLRSMELLGVDRLDVSDHALREGLIVEQMRALATPSAEVAAGHRLSEVRRAGVVYVAERFDEDLRHAEHITDLALELFEALVPLHRIEADHDLLEAAGLLHNVGMYISHSAHHLHSYYIVRNSEHLAGFTEREIEVVALVARYHRKSAPKAKHAAFAALPPDSQRQVQWMAAALRVAIGLDRTNQRLVSRVSVDPAALAAGDCVRLLCRINPDSDASVELFSAKARGTLLEELTGFPLHVEATVEPNGPQIHPSLGERNVRW